MTRRRQLAEAIVGAFPDVDGLIRALQFGDTKISLAKIVGVAGALKDIAYNLVEWAVSQGKIRDVTRACWQENPGNAGLAEFAMWVRYFAPMGDAWIDDAVVVPASAQAGADTPWDADVFFSFAAGDESVEDALRRDLRARPDPNPGPMPPVMWGWAADAAPPQWVVDRAARTRAWVVTTSAAYAKLTRPELLDWLAQKAPGRLNTAQPGTLTTVAVDDAAPDGLPQALAAAKPLRLFNVAAGVAGILRPPSPAYFAVVEDLARAVAPAAAAAPLSAGTVLLAEVTDDLDDVRDDVKRFLNQAGWAVLPDQLQYPRTDEAAFEAAVSADLGMCKLFVQLLSEHAGKLAPPARARSFVRIQYDDAAARAPAIPMLQWRRRDLNVAGLPAGEHRNLLGGLDGREVLAEDLQAFKDEILRVLNKPADLVPESDDANILIQSWDDAQQVDAIIGVLDGMGVWYGVRDGGVPDTQVSAAPDVQRAASSVASKPPPLDKYDGLIIVYGHGMPPQISKYLMDVWEAAPGQYFGLGVYHAPPPPPQRRPLQARLPRVETLDCRGGFKEPVIRSFVERVRKLKKERAKK